MRRAWVMLGLLALVAASCGGDDGTASGANSAVEQELVNAIRDEILSDEDPNSPFGETEATCVGERAVARFGVEGLLELGVTVDNANPSNAFETATEDQIDGVIDVTLDCVDFQQVFIDEITADAEISDESANCLGDQLGSRQFLRPIVEAGFRGAESSFLDDPTTADAIITAIFDCFSPEELLEFGN